MGIMLPPHPVAGCGVSGCLRPAADCRLTHVSEVVCPQRQLCGQRGSGAQKTREQSVYRTRNHLAGGGTTDQESSISVGSITS